MAEIAAGAADTIAAVATAVAPGQGSVAIVRISGPRALAIGRTLFAAPGRQQWESHRVLYGHVVDPASGERVDEALLLLMQAPRSFTREDVVELHCHGGLVAVRRVLELVLAAGARRALPGEFSQRAFLNGIDGGLQRRMVALRGRLLDQLAELEARVDFEEDLPPLDGAAVAAELAAVRSELEQLVAEARQGELLREGLRVAIVGRPNVGKSSLLNRLSRRERAIVTDLPGTTRDLLESELVLDGVPLTLLDTAGIRPTSDRVEQLGIARSREALAAADAVLLLFDLAAGWTADDEVLRQQVPAGVPLLLVGNKADAAGIPAGLETGAAALPPPADLSLSALSGEGLAALEAALLRCCGAGPLEGLQVALNQRQRDLAAAASASLERALTAAEQQLPWDFWTIDLRAAVRSLGAITGEEVSEAVLDRVFARFCIGK
jgi:tRNA modification GTPase